MTDPHTYEVLVIGAGAAGLMAAICAGRRGKRTLLLEKNTKPGVKILMSGGTRCNLTQNTDSRGIIAAYGDQGRFLHSALALLSPQQLVKFFNDAGVPTKIEDTNKIFPASDRALDVLQALLIEQRKSGADLALNEPVTSIVKQDEHFLVDTPSGAVRAEKLILTTGGQSYPGCGTIGEGYAWAKAFGHTIVPPRPALVPLTTGALWVHALSGLTMPDVRISIVVSSRAKSDLLISPEAVRSARQLKKANLPLAEDRGSLLFTHVGFSGPIALNVSRAISGHPTPQVFDLVCDFLPDSKLEPLEEELKQSAASDGKRSVLNLLARHIPKRLAESFFQERDISLDLRAADLSKVVRRQLVEAIKQTRIPLTGTLGFKKAEVTAGGIALGEVDSHTMQSKLVPQLYFAGEVLDLDGPIGGYNFQAAFSTGMLAGESV